MKIRQGFVSNSSSSSFVAIAATVVNIEHITKEMIKEHNIITFGMYRNEGIDLIEINDEMMLNYFKLFPSYEDYDGCTENFVFYKVIKSGNDGLIFNKSELSENEEYTILNEDVDYNCCRNLDDLFDLYQRDINKEDRKKYIDRMIRQNKFERILKK